MIRKKRLKTMDPINLADLPEPIVHHIMSFLTTMDVTRLSVLSKKFFSLWSSYPVMEFDQKRVNANFEGVSVDSRFDTAILMVLKNGFLSKTLMEFELHSCNVKCIKIDAPNLRSFIFSSSKYNPKPCHIDVLKCRNIKYFSLNNVVNGRDWIEEHVFTLSELRTFILNGCQDIGHIRVWNDKLERVEFRGCNLLTSIELKATSLESFTYKGNEILAHGDMGCNITFFASKCIKYLSIKGAALITDRWLEVQLAKMTRLERLKLEGCNSLRKIKVIHEKLQILELCSCLGLVEAEIHTPQLISFMYQYGSENIAMQQSDKMVTDQWLEALLAKMTRLERLKLEGCNSLRKIKVIHDKLQILELCSCLGLVEAEIHTPQLISFTYQYGNENAGQQSDKMVTDQWLEALLAKMTLLERLRLKCCNSLKKIKVLHAKLQILELYSCNGLEEADIDTPQLVSFVYHGNVIELGKMVTRTSCIATLSMKEWTTYDNASFCKWRNLLSFFGHFKALTLICNSPKEMMMPELHRERLVSPLYGLQHLEIRIKLLGKIDSDLVDGLLWLSPLPNTLHVSTGSGSRMQMINIKFVYSHMIEGEEDRNPFCCGTKAVKCWKHHLKRVEIQSSDVSHKNKSNELQRYFLTNARMSDLIVSVN
ncbi:hypothetical protein M8C21_006881 [Ambrosia artemisiifolia]|uniref:F-box domain-containing protein n=1 Tax=Ambrosia artemisiifolia TaxID=4212 RepID=A0AAD5CGQ1_AMBAR|nr:hypothetical protein M8C21_006881 [Ambrosia artemisiifolia]